MAKQVQLTGALQVAVNLATMRGAEARIRRNRS
jgi:hypothetical protein